MRQQIILWGVALAAFAVTLGISASYEGLWHSDDAPTAQDIETARRTRTLLSASVPEAAPARPFAPPVAAPAPPPATVTLATAQLAAAAPNPPAPAPFTPVVNAPESEETRSPELTQSEPQSEPPTSPDIDNAEILARRDRAAARGTRSH